MSMYPMGHSLKNRKTQKFYPDQNRRWIGRLSEIYLFTGAVTAVIYFCPWNDDKNQQSGEWQV